MIGFKTTGLLPGRGRTGILTTPHGDIRTPVFMPVGTNATVKSLSPTDLESIGAQIILANNYHLYLRPGSQNVAALGGIHKFMAWDKPVLTDSGGFQIFSLAKSLVKTSPDGISFKSHLDGSSHFWTPEDAIASQELIGADIIMPLDICTPDASSHSEAKMSLDITQDWLVRCKAEWQKTRRSPPSPQALFGIIQGGLHKNLRREAAKFIANLDLPGIAVGGETIGYNMSGTAQVADWMMDLLPADKPRYAMGVGLVPSDLARAVSMGFDMFDCVAPTRLARNGTLYSSGSPTEKIDISKSQFKLDANPIDSACDCPTCQKFTRAYLHHLFKSRELLYYRLASLHNLRTMIRTLENLNCF